MTRTLVCLLGLALAASCAPALADEAPDCGNVFFVKPWALMGPPNSVVAEIFINEAGREDYSLRGLLLGGGDWGALRMCVPSFSVQVRWITRPLDIQHRGRVMDHRQISINRAGRSDVFLNFDTFREMPEKQGAKEIIGVEEHWKSASWTGRWDFDKDRYDQICLGLRPGCGEVLRPPEAASPPR